MSHQDHTPALAVHEVSVTFGGMRALNTVSLAVAPHTVAGLIGPNGAGKTTLLNAISGLQRIDSGRIEVGGHDVTHLPPSIRTSVGVGRSFQNLGLMPDETVLANVMAAQYTTAPYRDTDILLRPWRWRSGERRLREAALDQLHVFGVDHVANVRVRDLSFAAARFVELSCVFVLQPKLLLLDEPTTGLDLAEVQTLSRIVKMAREAGQTAVVVAHDVSFVMETCDNVHVLASGSVLAEGPASVIRRDPAVIDIYLGAGA